MAPSTQNKYQRIRKQQEKTAEDEIRLSNKGYV
jgi:hypothetical protein